MLLNTIFGSDNSNNIAPLSPTTAVLPGPGVERIDVRKENGIETYRTREDIRQCFISWFPTIVGKKIENCRLVGERFLLEEYMEILTEEDDKSSVAFILGLISQDPENSSIDFFTKPATDSIILLIHLSRVLDIMEKDKRP